jgi:hypothetical protein
MNKFFRSSGIYEPLLSVNSLRGISELIKCSSPRPVSVGQMDLNEQYSVNSWNTSLDVSYYKNSFSIYKAAERVKLASVHLGTQVIHITGAKVSHKGNCGVESAIYW